MSITTKTGDQGMTGTFGTKRVRKDDVQIEAIGSLDEASVVVGFVREQVTDQRVRYFLSDIQEMLYTLMGILAGASVDTKYLKDVLDILESAAMELEHKLPSLTQFILPQGGQSALWCHQARVVIRRAERAVVSYLYKNKDISDAPRDIIAVLNRMSDYFFHLARMYAVEEVQPRSPLRKMQK